MLKIKQKIKPLSRAEYFNQPDPFIYHTGPINDFLGTEVVVDFPPETKSRVEKQTTTEVPRKSYRPKCGINFYQTSYKILVESITL